MGREHPHRYAVYPRTGAGPLRGAPLSGKIVALETLGRHEEAEDLARRGSAMGCLHHAIEPGRAGSAYRQMRQADRNMESEVSS